MKAPRPMVSGREFDEVKKPKKCDCIGWIKSMRLIEGAQILAWSHGFTYDGDRFVFCPWCGKELA